MGILSQHDKQVLVFSTAGKPIYSLHGNEEDLAELMATAEAIISVVQSQKQSLSYVRYEYIWFSRVLGRLYPGPMASMRPSLEETSLH